MVVFPQPGAPPPLSLASSSSSAGPTRHASLLAWVVALLLHGGAAALLVMVNPARFTARDQQVEMDVVEPPPPPPENHPEPPPPPREPKSVPRHVALAPASKAPPPPNQEPPPSAPLAPPVFGITMDSVVGGDSTMAVPVGNTVATSQRDPAAPGGPPPAAYANAGPPAFAPVADVYITQQPQIIFEVNSADIYPTDARRLGVEGTVQLRVGIDENGDVKEVRVTRVNPSGYHFDEAARGALMKAKFRPARGSDGKPVPARINYNYTFTLGQ